MNLTAVGINDITTNGQSQTRTPVFSRREKRFKNPGERIGADALSGVLNAHPKTCHLPHDFFLNRQLKLASLRHGFYRVLDDIEDHLFQLISVSLKGGQFLGRLKHDLKRFLS